MSDQKLSELEIYAWVGEDELGSGEIGLKQALVPAGMIPMVAIDRNKIAAPYIVKQMQEQQNFYGKKIYLVKFKFAEIVQEIARG